MPNELVVANVIHFDEIEEVPEVDFWEPEQTQSIPPRRFNIGDEVRIVSNSFPDDPTVQGWFSSRLSIGAIGRITRPYSFSVSTNQWEYEVGFDGYENDGSTLYQSAYDLHLEKAPKIRKKSGISKFWSKHGI